MAIWLRWMQNAWEDSTRTWIIFMKLSLRLTDAYGSVEQYT